MPSPRLTALSRSTRHWVASLGTAALLPLVAPAQADTIRAPGPTDHEVTTLKGHFIDTRAFKPTLLRNQVPVGSERLREETGLDIRRLEADGHDRFPGLQVLIGRAENRQRNAMGASEIYIATRDDGRFVALLPDAGTIIRGDADGEQTLIRFDAPHAHAPHVVDSLEPLRQELPGTMESRSGQRSLALNRNAAGELVIDLLAGFSARSATYIGDHEAYALAQVASVNRALEQSRVPGVRLRLVGTQVLPDDLPVTTASLSRLGSLFADGMGRYSPDLVAAFVVGEPKQDTAVGWAYVNGRYSINYINSAAVFRHEVAHNAGGSHCSDGSSHKFGYNNGRVGTILCGNQVPFFSNPELKDRLGLPLGDARTANMARVWRENAAKMSAYSPSVVALADERQDRLLEERVSLGRDQWHYIPLDVPEGTRRLVILGSLGDGSDRGNDRAALLLKRGAKPTADDHDLASRDSISPFLALDEPAPGRWYLAVRPEKGRALEDMHLQSFAYAVEKDHAKARYLRLVATSSIDGKALASAAELNLADARGRLLSREGWRVHSVSSANAASEGGSHAIDGRANSYWTTVPGAAYPHEMVIDLGAEQRFSQLHYLPQQVRGLEGNIKGYRIYGSDSPTGDWSLLGEGEFAATNDVQVAGLKAREAAQPPLVAIAGVTEAEAGAAVTLDASASSDPQGGALSYAWSVTPRLDYEFDGPRLAFKAPELDRDTRYVFTLTLDNGRKSASSQHTVLVKAHRSLGCQPDWSAQTIYWQGDKVQLGGRLFEARWWSRGQRPGDPAFTGGEGSGKVWSDLGVCQGDAKPETPPAEPPAILPPQASIDGLSEARAGDNVRLSAAGSSDPNGLPLTYRWSVTPSLDFQAKGADLSFVAPKLDKDQTYSFSLVLGNGHHQVTRNHQVRVQGEPIQHPGACAQPWSAGAVYQEQDQVTHGGRLYQARWWTRGSEPGNPAFTGADGSGKVWRDQGTCR